MKNTETPYEGLVLRLRQMITDKMRLNPEEVNGVATDAPLLEGSLHLDSLDALELAMCIEDEFGIAIHSRDESRQAFGSFANLARFIHHRLQVQAQTSTRDLAIGSASGKFDSAISNGTALSPSALASIG